MVARFRIETVAERKRLSHVWEHTVGSGRALLALRADWQTQLRRASHELGFRRVRFHGILSDEIGTLVCQKNALLHSFHNVDAIYDSLLEMGVRPFVELGFMPTAIASGDRTVFRYRGNVTPPRDMKDWDALIRLLAEHWVDRYGIDEVRAWHFEVWNEPNLPDFWAGTRSEYFRLYLHTARNLKEIDPDLRIGGPATAKNEWIPEFLDFCEGEDVPVDFVTTHHYPTDAFGESGEDIEAQLSRTPRRELRDQARAARHAAGSIPLFYTEWNTSSSSHDAMHDQPYAAAFVVRTVLDVADLVEGYAFWTFTDIFDESYFPSLPFHGGFGLMSLHGIPKPAYRAFELLHALGEERLPVAGRHATVDAWAVRKDRDVTIVLTNHAFPRQPIATEVVRIEVEGSDPRAKGFVQRIDEEHANATGAWRAMGAPEYPSREQVRELEEASRIPTDPLTIAVVDGVLHASVELPPQAVAAVTLEGIHP